MKNLQIIVNKKAKNASLLNDYLAVFDRYKLDYQLYEVEPSALDKTIKLACNESAVLLIGGGDGTVRTAAQTCSELDITLGVLPFGTLNHFFSELELPQEPDLIAKTILMNKVIKIDLAEVNGLKFLNNSSIGVYPHFARRRDHYSKFYNKWLSYIPGIIESLRYHEIFNATLHLNKEQYKTSTCFLMVSNNLYSYQFPLTLKRGQFNQGVLGIYLYKHGKLKLARLFDAILDRADSFEVKQSNHCIKVEINNRKKIDVSLDGETVTLETPLIYKIHPKSLTILKDSL